MTVLVTGASGHVGRAVLDQLLAAGADVRASSRDPGTAQLPAGVPVVAADLTRPETLPAALTGVTRVFLYAQPEGIDNFVQAAQAAGVEQVVFLSSASLVEPGAADNPIAQHHRAVEQALERSGLAWTFVRPGAFATNALQWARAIRAEGVVRIPYPQSESAPIHEADIAAVAVAALTGDTTPVRGYPNAAPHLTGPESLTQERQVTLIGEAIGRGVRCVELTPDQARTEMGSFMPPQFVEVLLRTWAATDGVPATISDAVAQFTGRPARSFASWAHDHAADFRP